MTDGNKGTKLNAQHFGSDRADIRSRVRINPKIYIRIPRSLGWNFGFGRGLRCLGTACENARLVELIVYVDEIAVDMPRTLVFGPDRMRISSLSTSATVRVAKNTKKIYLAAAAAASVQWTPCGLFHFCTCRHGNGFATRPGEHSNERWMRRSNDVKKQRRSRKFCRSISETIPTPRMITLADIAFSRICPACLTRCLHYRAACDYYY